MFTTIKSRVRTRELHARRRVRIGTAVLAFSTAAIAAAQATDADMVTAQVREIGGHLVAYGQVEPINVVPVSAAEGGVVTGLSVRPGMHVHAGQILAHLSGPAIKALLLQGGADVRNAQAQLDSAEKSLAIEKEQLPSHLTTQQAVHQAESAEAQARTALENAQAQRDSVRLMTTISAPTDGVVMALNSADGAVIGAGQPILTLQPANGLWLRAMYYGADLASIRVGMTGEFAPSDGSRAIAVKVTSVLGALVAGGGESVALVPVHGSAAWLNGESGTVKLDLPSRKLVEIPTRALVLNQGKWWVMVHTAQGDRPQAVIPGPAEGWQTAIESGLAPGAKVIVKNAYLLFHSQISEQYQIPD